MIDPKLLAIVAVFVFAGCSTDLDTPTRKCDDSRRWAKLINQCIEMSGCEITADELNALQYHQRRLNSLGCAARESSND